MAKAILLVRVSTTRQEMDEQERELYDLAIKDGYKDSEIIPIAEKESAIKLSEEERNGLNRMKEEIANGNVNCVYVWEISRLARRQKVLHSVIDYLADRKIQLIVKTPYIKYLNDDGSRNEGSEMMVAMLALGAETEIRKLKERERRTKSANALKGIWNGGASVKYGYRLDEENHYIVDDDEAKVIRLIYHLYIESRLGQRALRKELESRGIRLTEDRIRKILSDEGYVGKPYRSKVWKSTLGTYDEGNLIKYPAIIDEETFRKAEKKREVANKNVYKGTKYFFASGLIRCPLCGHSYTGFDYDNLYMCIAHRHSNTDIPKCPNNVTINLTALDSLLWYLSYQRHFKWLYENSEEQKKSLNDELKVLDDKISSEQAIIDHVEQQLEDIGDMVISGLYTKDKAKTKAKLIRDKAAESQAKIIAYKQRQSSIIEVLNDDTMNQTDSLIQALDGILSVDSFKQMCDIVHRYITNVDVDKYPYDEIERKNGIGPYRIVTIRFIDGMQYRYLVYARGDDYRFTSYDIITTPEPENIKIIQRGVKGNSRLSPKQRLKRKQGN